jgi:DNA-damage-inducible protein D
MKTETIQILQNQFDAISQRIPGEDVKFWFARDLQELLRRYLTT